MCYSSACTFLTLILYLEIYQYLILRGNLTQYGGDWRLDFWLKIIITRPSDLSTCWERGHWKKLQLVLVCWYCEKVSFRINDTWQGRGWGRGGWQVARGHGSDLNPVPLWWGYSLYKRVACFTKWATATPVSSYFLMLLLCSWRQRFWSKTGNCWVTFPGGDQVVLGSLPNQSVLTWESDSAINFEWCVYKLQLTNLT